MSLKVTENRRTLREGRVKKDAEVKEVRMNNRSNSEFVLKEKTSRYLSVILYWVRRRVWRPSRGFCLTVLTTGSLRLRWDLRKAVSRDWFWFYNSKVFTELSYLKTSL